MTWAAQVRVQREALHAGGPSSVDFIYFYGSNNKQ
jgi:hypothetical protein